MKFIYDVLNIKNKQYFDINLILQNNKSELLKSYINFSNKNMKSIDILQDIFNLSLCSEFINHKYTTQFSINQSIVISDINIIDDWLKNNIDNCSYVNYNYPIIINNYLVGIIDLILDNRIIIINNNKPHITEYIKYLLYLEKYNNDNDIQINIIQLYNPLEGIIIEWNIENYNGLYKYFYLIKNFNYSIICIVKIDFFL